MPKTNSKKTRGKRRKTTDRIHRQIVTLMHEIEMEALHFHRILEMRRGKVAHANDLKLTIEEAVRCLQSFASIISK